jgi:hypothetical protein
MTNSCRLLNHLDAEGVYLRFYTELDSNFQVGDKLFIVGGNYDNTIYTNKEHADYDPYNKYAAGYEVISVDTTALSNAVTLNITYRDAKFTSGGIESFVFDPKPVYKTEEELLLYPNQVRESYISKSYFKRGEFNGGKFQDGLFGEYNSIGATSAIPYQRNKAVANLKEKLVAIVESNESSEEEVVDAVNKLTIIAANQEGVYNKLESHSTENKAIFNNNFNNVPAEWSGGVFVGGNWQWGEWKSKYATTQTGKHQKLNDKKGIRSLLDTAKYDIVSFTDNNGGIGYNQFVTGNIGNIFEAELFVTVDQNNLLSIEYLPHEVQQAMDNHFTVEMKVDGKPVSFTSAVSISATGVKATVQFSIVDTTAKPNRFSTGKLMSAHWFNGSFEDGLFDGGKWHGGYFKSGTIRSNYERAYWFNGVFDGQKDTAFAENLRWFDGQWKNGNWKGDANISIDAIAYGDETIILTINSKYMHLFEIGENVFVSYIKKALQNEYLNSYTDQPFVNLLNMQSFKLQDIVAADEYRVKLVLKGKADQNIQNINLQFAKVSQSFFKKGVWFDGIWESGLREVKNVDITSFEYTKETGVLSLLVDDTTNFNVGDAVELTNLQGSELTEVDPSRPLQTIYKSLDATYAISSLSATGITINIGTAFQDVTRINTEVGSTQIATTLWYNGEFRSGVWDGGLWKSNTNDSSVFRNYLYFDTQNTQIQSIWKGGYWKGGKFSNAVFLSGIWQNGVWENGIMTNLNGESVWLDGVWQNGTLNRGLFLSGKMLNGTIINGGVSNIDWKTGSYANGLGLFNNTQNNNRSGRFLVDRNEYDSTSAPSIVYIDGNGWVQLDQPSFYQRNYSLIFQDLGFNGEYDNPYNNEMFTVKETKEHGTKLRIDNGKTGILDNPLAEKHKPIVAIGNLVSACELNHEEIMLADAAHKRLVKVNLNTGTVEMYGKILYGVDNHAMEFSNIKHIFKIDNSDNLYVVDDRQLKVLYKGENNTDVMFSVVPALLNHEEIIDLWVAPSITNIGETVFLLTNLGNIHYWVNVMDGTEVSFKQVRVTSDNTYTIHNFSGARSDSAKTHFILNCTSALATPELRHVVLDYSNANNEYEVTRFASSSELSLSNAADYESGLNLIGIKPIKRVAIKLENSEIKIWALVDELVESKQSIYLLSYKKYFLNTSKNGSDILGSFPDKNILDIKLGYNSENLCYIQKKKGYDVEGALSTVAHAVVVGRMGVAKLEQIADYTLTSRFVGYKVSKVKDTTGTKELSPYVTGRVLYNTKINQEVAFNPNGSVYSAHVVSASWNNGLFVGSWDAPTYVDHKVLDKKSIFVDGTFEGVFHDGFFLGGTFRDRNSSSASVVKQGHFISDANNISWQSGKIISDIRYEIDAISIKDGKMTVSVDTRNNASVAVDFSKLNRGAVVEIPALFKKRELAVHAVLRGEIYNIDAFDEVILKVDKPDMYNEAYWVNTEIFLSSSEFTQDLFGYQYVTHANIAPDELGVEYLYLTIRNKFNTFSGASNIHVFTMKPKILVGQYLKVESIAITSTGDVKNNAAITFHIPMPAESSLEDFKKYYILDSIDVVAYAGAGQVLIPDYLQVFPLTFAKSFKDVSLKFNSAIRNIYFNNIIDDSNVSVVSVDLKSGTTLAYNIMVNNSYVTSTKASDGIADSVFLSGKTDRVWNSGLWLNLDDRGFSNGKSVFGGMTSTMFNGYPMKIVGYTVEDKDLVITLEADATDEFETFRYITLRGFKGDKANILGSTRSRAFRIKEIDEDKVRIKNPFIYYADYNPATINSLLQVDSETMKVKNVVNRYIGVENTSIDVTFDYALASRSCWNGGDFTGDFSAVWNAGNFMGGSLNRAAKWYGSHESEYWAGEVTVESNDSVDVNGYEVKADITESGYQAGDYVYVKFIANFINNTLLHVYNDFYAVATEENGIVVAKNVSNILLPDEQINEAGEVSKIKYAVQVIRYRKAYNTSNDLVVNYNKTTVLPEYFSTTSKAYEIARVSFFYGGNFNNAIWHNGVFVGGSMLPDVTNNRTVWKYGIKHNGHLGGNTAIDPSRHIHWLGGFHDAVTDASVSSVKNIVWYRGVFNGGAWLNGNWHSLDLTNAYVNDTWSKWNKGEWYSKGRSFVSTVIATSIPTPDGTIRGTKTIDGYTLNIGEKVFVHGNATQNGFYTVSSGVWTKESYSAYDNYVLYVQKGTTNGGKLFHVSTTLTQLNNGSNVNNTSYTKFNESIWHGGTWSSDVIEGKDYTYESNQYKIYGLRNGGQAEYPKTTSIWLGGAWLRGVWNGGVFANGSWHSVNSVAAVANDSLYERGVLYKYDKQRSIWNGGMMVNSIWNGGTVSTTTDPLDVVFGDMTNFDYISVDGDFNSMPNFKFKKNDNFATTILGKKVFDKNTYNVSGADHRIYMQESSNNILPVYWRRGVWNGGLIQFSYWQNLNLENVDTAVVSKAESDNWSFFERGCFYSSYWEGGLLKANASLNTASFESQGYLEGVMPSTVFYRSQWEKGYWQAVGINRTPENATIVDQITHITDALFSRSIWNAGVFEGGIFDLSVWCSGTKAATQIGYNGSVITTTASVVAAQNPFHAVNQANNLTTDISGVKNDTTFFTSLASLRYVGNVDNFASVWVNGTMRGSVWHGGIWQRGMFKHRNFEVADKLDFFDVIRTDATEHQVGVWTRGAWLSGYFSYFNDMSMLKSLNNSHFRSENGVRCLFMGMKAQTFTNTTYDRNNILGGNISYTSELGTDSTLETEHNKASVFSRRMLREGDTHRYFTIFNGTMVNGTILTSVTGSNAFEKMIVSPFATVSKYGYKFDNTTRSIDLLTNVNYGASGEKLIDVVNTSFSLKADGTQFTIPYNPSAVPVLCVGSGNSLVRVPESSNLLHLVYNGHFHNQSGTNNGIWRHNHSYVGDGNVVSTAFKSIEQGSAMKWHEKDVLGGEPNYSNDGLDAYENEDGIQSLRQP